jgi:PPM family protein phosphatase
VEDDRRPQAEPRVVFAGVTDVGRQRKHNEDCLLIKGEHGLFCVADGMGGHNAGDVASKLVATSLGNYFEATAPGRDGRAPAHDLPEEYAALSPGARRLAAGVSKANRDVFTISNTHQQHHGMGSTCVAIHLAEGMVHVAHVGDSRCYRIRDGEITQMTRDHSLINDALDMKPDLTKEELARLPKNIITRALGMKDGVKVDIKSEATLPGDLYLLCSDGLTGMVPVDHILDVINLTPEPQEACELLIAEANDHGGTDNISALLVRIEDPTQANSPDEIDISAHAELEHDDELNADTLAELVSEGELTVEGPPSPRRTAPTVRFAVPTAAAQVGGQVGGQVEGARPPNPVAVRPFIPPPPPVPVARATPAPPVPVPIATAPVPVLIAAAPVLRAPIVEATSPVAELQRVDDDDGNGDLEGLLTPEEAAALASGGEIDLDVRGPWPGTATVPRCAKCRFELFPGNRFCVECGARIEAAIA